MVNRCRTTSVILIVSLILQVVYSAAEGLILLLQGPLKQLLNSAPSEMLQDDLYPMVDVVMIAAVLLVHGGLFILLWTQGEKGTSWAPEIAAIVVAGLLLVGSPVSFTILSNMYYGTKGAETVVNYSILQSIMGYARPLSRLALVFLLVGATSSLGNKRHGCGTDSGRGMVE